jgi:lipid A ethanolaminephosphotransferase
MQLKISLGWLVLLVSIFFTLFYNYALFSNAKQVYGCNFLTCIELFSVAIVLTSAIFLVLTIITYKKTTKPILIILFLISSITTYFMNTYNVVIDDSMIRNALQTDIHESLDLLSLQFFLYFLFLGVIPSFLIYKTTIIYPSSWQKTLISKLKSLFLTLLVALVVIFSFSKFYTSFFREHKSLRYYSNPTYWIYSIGVYLQETYFTKTYTLQKIGLDAKIEDNTTRKIVFMIVGEAARADHFSLNGYDKETNPQLKKEDLINFSQLYSCGTSTAHSVPCMFSIYPRSEYDYKKALYTENVLDVLNHTNQVAILWRDNNSDSKGVATRIEYENYKSDKQNPMCDEECRDIGMLEGLSEYIKNNKSKNILIVLHQMGNHGPAYYKRYTKEYEKFKPTCKTNQLEQCTKEAIANAYDNALLYSDMFLAKTIALAKKYTKDNVAVLYMADHGESLGENGIYLHGLPYFIAPDAQKHVGAFLWLNKKFRSNLDYDKIKAKKNKKLSHDYLFHTLLGLFGVKTKVYDKKLDITH